MAESLESNVMRFYRIRFTKYRRWYAEKKETTPNSNLAEHLISETASYNRRLRLFEFLKSHLVEIENKLCRRGADNGAQKC